MKENEYPNLYISSNNAAITKQKHYFRYLAIQYIALIIASSLTLFTGFWGHNYSLITYLALLLIASVSALLLATQKPQQEWYNMRALAESCKTLSWRYMMQAEPFHEINNPKKSEQILAEKLYDLLSVHGANSDALIQQTEFGDVITNEMRTTHSFHFHERSEKYLNGRIDNQLHWYQEKASFNKSMSSITSYAIVFVYILAIALTLYQLEFDIISGQVFWISEPLLVLAASIIGISQAKRFSELSASYTLTALEIKKLKVCFMAIKNEDEFTKFVNDAETAFSREHTQWMARQA